MKNFSIPEYPQLQLGSIYCIGRNYAKHVEEMKSEILDDPVVFLKPRSSVIFNGGRVILPESSNNIHHEVELVLMIGELTHKATVAEAQKSIKAVAVGLDITARDLQANAKQKGLPWALSKGFHTFAPVGNFAELNEETDLQNLDLWVNVNGETRQHGNTEMMLFSSADIVSYLSRHFILNPGDLIFTGTPEGVSQITDGDTVEAGLGDHISSLKVYVQA